MRLSVASLALHHRLVVVALVSVLFCGCQTAPPSELPISKTDHINPWFGPRKHYEHVVRNKDGTIKEVYRYYLDEENKPVLDGERVIYRWKHDPGLILEYRNGRLIRKSEVIVTGG
jgi:hypothetical protein